MLENFTKMIGNLITLPIIIGVFLGFILYVVNTFRTQFKIENIIFTQALEEKFKFKDTYLNESFQRWQRDKIKSGEIK